MTVCTKDLGFLQLVLKPFNTRNPRDHFGYRHVFTVKVMELQNDRIGFSAGFAGMGQ